MIDHINLFQFFPDLSRIENITLHEPDLISKVTFAKEKIEVAPAQVIVNNYMVYFLSLRQCLNELCSNIPGATGDEDVHLKYLNSEIYKKPLQLYIFIFHCLAMAQSNHLVLICSVPSVPPWQFRFLYT